MKNITWDERYIALNIYSSYRSILLSGFLAGFLLALIFSICFFPVMSVVISLRSLYFLSVVSSGIGFSLSGLIAAHFVYSRVKESWEEFGIYEYNESLSLVVFCLGLAGSGFCVLLSMVRAGLELNVYVWVFPVVVALILGSFVCHIWRVIQSWILARLFMFNPNYLVNEKRFKDQLKLKISEVKRYGGPCAVMAVSIDRKEQVIKKYGESGWVKLNEELVKMFNTNTRETDVFGQIGDGTIIISLTHTDREGAHILSQRIGRYIQERSFVINRHSVQVSISIGVSFFGDVLKNAEDLTLAAISAVNRATEGDGQKIVYHDGNIQEETIDGDVA